MDEVTGWIKLSRKILQEQWYLGEKFTKAMCWIDLLLLAEWRKERTFFVRGIEVVVSRGQVALPLTEISKRWNLAVNTVRARLREMKNDGRISVKADNIVTRITILNWEKYQGIEIPAESVEAEYAPPCETQPDVEPPKVEKTVAVIEEVTVEEVPVAEPLELPPSKPKKPEVDCNFVLRLYHDRCPSLPKVKKLSDKRKMKIRVRFQEMNFDYEIMQQVFDKAEASSFMRGDNKHGWRADFDWIFTNDTNWVKILEGKYDDRKPITITTIRPTNGSIENPGITPVSGGGYTPTTASQRQKLSVLTTLAKIESEQGGYIPTGDGSKE